MSTMKLCFKVVCLFLLLARILLAQTRLLMVAWFAAGLTNHIDILIQIQLKLNFCSSPLRSIDMLLMRALTDNCVLLDLEPSSCSHKLKLFYGNFVAFALMVNWDLSRINEVSISCDANFMSWIPYTSFLTGEHVCLLLQSHHGLVH